METTTLDNFMSWNDQLAAAIDAGVPLDLGLAEDTGDVALALEKINALVARRTSQGMSVAAAIDSNDAAIPPAYRCLMQLSLSSGTLLTGLAPSNRLARKVDRAWDVGRLALVYPAIVCCLVFLGIVGFCLYFVPVLQGTYENLNIKAGRGLQLLELLRASMPYWAVIFPVGLVASALWMRRRSRPLDEWRCERLLGWIPGISKSLFEERAANFAETTAKLLESGADRPESLQVAADVWNDRSLAEAVKIVALRTNSSLALGCRERITQKLPPFLRWALLDSEATTGRVCALRIAADVYRRAAARRQARLRIIVPLIVAMSIGGVATLLYGLALFVPVIEMLCGLNSEYAG